MGRIKQVGIWVGFQVDIVGLGLGRGGWVGGGRVGEGREIVGRLGSVVVL